MSKIDTTVLTDGQLAVATLAQTGTPITGSSVVDTTALVETEQGPQLCVKTYSVGGGGGGGADTNLSNLTNTGKTQAAHLAMPSTVSEDIAVGASGTKYLAPADGYFTFRGLATGSGNYAYIGDANFKRVGFQGNNWPGGWIIFTVPVLKNDEIVINYILGEDVSLSFIYAEGSKSEAN